MRAHRVARLRRGFCAARRRRGQEENHTYISRQRYQFRLVCFSAPSCSAEQRSGAGGSRRGRFEGRSPEFRSRPAVRVAQGSRRSRPRNAGVAFSLAPFFWRPKRKDARASGAENSVSESQQRPKRSRRQPLPNPTPIRLQPISNAVMQARGTPLPELPIIRNEAIPPPVRRARWIEAEL